MTDIVLGPVLSLYSVAFYRRVARQRLGRGLAYLVYLSSLYSASISIALLAFWLPAVDRFVDWLAPNLPEVKLTDHGAVTDAPQPFVLTHPVLGTLLVIDTRRETPSADDLRGAPVFISRTQVVVSEGPAGQRRVYDLMPQTPEARARWEGLVVNGASVKKIYGRLRLLAAPLAFVAFLVFFFVWKFLAALAYSVLGLVLNLLRRERLPYASILTLACFAMTAVIVLQTLAAFGAFGSFRLSYLTAWLVTGAYLALAMLLPGPVGNGPAGQAGTTTPA
jgi:hypothetical protein